MLRLLLVLAYALAFSGAAAAQDRPADWIKRPRIDDIMAVFPADAADREISGKAVLVCIANVEGRLVGCKVESESPPNMNFGRAALAVTPQMLMRPALRGGQPVPSEVRIPITFPIDRSPRLMMREKVVTIRGFSSTISWQKAPSHADLRAAYPEKARAAGVGGAVALQCGFDAERNVRNCEVLKEEPRGYGFGLAAKIVAKQFTLPPVEITKPQLLHATTQIAVSFSPTLLSGAPATGKPVWTRLPSAEAFSAALGGSKVAADVIDVRLRCGVVQGGGLDACEVVSEKPAASGFGAAALNLAPYFTIATWTSEGLPVVGGRVVIPLLYRVETKVETTAKPAG
jgi:TonB family protein